MSTNDAKKIAVGYAESLKRKGFPFSRVYLYGSHAKGSPHQWSDIDVCVISDAFGGEDWLEQEQKLWHLRRDIDARIEPLGMTPEEFASNVSPMAHEVKTTGIRVA